jgi:DcmR-like sensory protein
MVAPGHTAQFYRDERFLIDSITSFIRVGLDLNETVLAIVTAPHREKVCTTLTGKELRNDKLRFFDARDFLALFMVEDWPNESQFMQGMKTILGLAGETGQVRVFGEAVEVLCAEGKATAALRLEELGNILALTHHCSVLCAYSLSTMFEKADQETRTRVCQLHGDVQIQ